MTLIIVYRILDRLHINIFPVPAPEPECRVDADCPSRLACLNEVCRDPCAVLSPCGQNADCTVQNTLPQRTMICMCRPGYVGDADVACNLRKMIILVVGPLTPQSIPTLYIYKGPFSLSNHIKHINYLAYHPDEFLSVFVVVFTNIRPLTSSASSIWLLIQLRVRGQRDLSEQSLYQPLHCCQPLCQQCSV